MKTEKGLSIYIKSKKNRKSILLYNITEICNDEIKLVKWHRDTTKVPRFKVYEKGILSEIIDK